MTKKKEKEIQSEAPKENKYSDKEDVKLVEKLDALTKEKDDLYAKLQRLSADYANYQKRSVKQIADSVSYEKEMVIKSLLPAIDNFEHTIVNSENAEDINVLAKGIKIVYDQIIDILKSHNVEQIKALGEPFDPSLHQAMMRRSETENEDGIVLEEFQKGYKLNGRVIRPSNVIVNKIEKPDNESAEDNEDKKVSDEE